MPSTPIDSDIFRDQFGTEEMRLIFSDQETIRLHLLVEAALARAQAGLGIIPERAAAEITEKAEPSIIDLPALKSKTDIVGYPIVGIVEQLGHACRDGLGEYVHWGATTQDIMDTTLAMQLGRALDLIDRDLERLGEALATLAATHRDTVMAGRTHLQHALPVTFGYKAAVWLSAVDRHRDRLSEMRPRIAVGQFAGAVGTLASVGEQGLDIQNAMMSELGLDAPDMVWHAVRDGPAEAVNLMGLVTATLAKIATDVMLMMQTEIGEAFEPFVSGRGSSSTMPQKRNPISCELIIAGAKTVRQSVALMLDAMIHDHERATGPWQAEWLAVPQALIVGHGSLSQAVRMMEGLDVRADAMRRNLDVTGGLIVAEAVMMGLAPHIGRQRAHDIVYDCCRLVLSEGGVLADRLLDVPEISDHLSRVEIERIVDPANYVGLAGTMVDRLLEGRRRTT